MSKGELSLDQINAILAQPERKRNNNSKSGIDLSIRTHETWFALAHKLIDTSTGELSECSNPNCNDPRTGHRRKMTANINGQEVCRYCFFDGYLLEDPNQTQLKLMGT